MSSTKLLIDPCFFPTATTPMLLSPASKNSLLEEEMQFMAIGQRKDPLDHLTQCPSQCPSPGKIVSGWSAGQGSPRAKYPAVPTLPWDVSDGDTAPGVDLAGNSTAYQCDRYPLLLTPGTGDPMPQLGLAQETSRDPVGGRSMAE